jgi:hypothetical protein
MGVVSGGGHKVIIVDVIVLFFGVFQNTQSAFRLVVLSDGGVIQIGIFPIC